MARLFTDENFSLPVVRELRGLGHDVRTVAEAGLADRGVPDSEILTVASRDSRAVLTLDRRDFLRLHLTRPDHAGIIICTADPDFTRQAGRIDAVLASRARLDGQLLRVNRPGPAEGTSP